MTDIHICTGFGGYDTRKHEWETYDTISRAEVWSMVANPSYVDKDAAQWIIPSEYVKHNAREFAVQRELGKYSAFLCWDIDKGNHELAELATVVRRVLGAGVSFAIYSSKSSKLDLKKWRVLVPINGALSGFGYYAFQTAFFDELAEHGIQADYALCRSAQLVYLPNRGEFYEYHYEQGGLLELRSHPMASKAAQVERLAVDMSTKQSVRTEGSRSFLGAFRRKHQMADLLQLYGFQTKNGINWLHPFGGSGSYGGFKLFEDGEGWFATAYGIVSRNIGKPATGGGRYGDAFDLYIHFNCGGNREMAEDYARQCLREEDEARLGDASSEHGKEVWENLQLIGNKLGPAGLQAEAAIVAEKINKMKASPDPSVSDSEDDWAISWPPGITGELAKHIYEAASRPVKQFAIASAFYIIAGMAGKNYNVQKLGLNIFMVIAGNSGSGKGEVRRITKRIYGEIAKNTQDPVGLSSIFDHDFPASGQGLRRMFENADKPRAMYKEDADAHLAMLTRTEPGSVGDVLRSTISTMYDQSGEGQVMGAVGYSKLENKVEAVVAPSLTLGLDTQIEPFHRFLGENVVLDTGLGSRFIYTSRYGKRMHGRKNTPESLPPVLLERLSVLWNAIRMNPGVTHVRMDPEAQADFDKMDYDVTEAINSGKNYENLKVRAHMNAAKIAACIAVMDNQVNPVVTKETFVWARKFVNIGYDICTGVLATGLAGSGERVRVAKALEAVKMYTTMPVGRRASYRVPKSLDQFDDIICESYMLERLTKLADFKGSDLTYSSEDLVRKTITELVRQEYLIEITRDDLSSLKNCVVSARLTQKIYQIGSNF